MAGVATCPVIALMQRLQLCPCPNEQTERDTMRLQLPLAAMASNREVGVSVGAQLQSPRPTVILVAPIDAGPEAANLRFGEFRIGGIQSSHYSRTFLTTAGSPSGELAFTIIGNSHRSAGTAFPFPVQYVCQ